jgi:hypothetical protein
MAAGAANAQETLVGPAGSSYEAGALSIQGAVPGPAYNGAVNIFNNYGGISPRIGFRTAAGTNLGRTNGAGDNGVASHAFAFKFAGFNGALPWPNTVPFAFGDRGGRDTLWTPTFVNVGILNVHNAQFSTDNGAGDEEPAVGVIKRGNFRAVDGDFGAAFNCARPGKVCFQRFNGTAWQQIGRTNGPGEDGNLLSFTVLTVRTSSPLDANGKVLSSNTSVPIAKISRGGMPEVLRLITPNYGNNIGTQMMLQY